MSEIKIKSVNKEDTGWTKEITLEREGETYLATLYWSSADGYELVFKANPVPNWVQEWDYASNGFLEEILDELTEREEE
jgi:hypothetical protein